MFCTHLQRPYLRKAGGIFQNNFMMNTNISRLLLAWWLISTGNYFEIHVTILDSNFINTDGMKTKTIKPYFIFSCLNPLIYGFMSKNFRKSFLFNIRSCCKCPSSFGSQQQSTSPTRNASIGYSRKHRNLSVASFVTTNTITHRTQDTNVFTTNKNVIELS